MLFVFHNIHVYTFTETFVIGSNTEKKNMHDDKHLER